MPKAKYVGIALILFCLIGTIITISPLGEVTPTHVVGFSKGGPDRKFVPNKNLNMNSENTILSITEIGKYMNITRNMSGFQNPR